MIPNKDSTYIDFYKIFVKGWTKNKMKIIKILNKENKEFDTWYLKDGFCAERYVPRQFTIDTIISLGEVDDKTFKEYHKFTRQKIHSTVASKNYLVMLFLLRFMTETKMNKYIDEVNKNLTIRFSSALMVKYFKYGCQNKIFNYWLNISTGKFLIKKFDGSLVKTLNFVADDTYVKEKRKLVTNSQDDLIYYNIRLRTRLNALLQNIANGYYTSLENGELEVQQSDVTNDQGEVISSQQNSHTEILSASEKAIEKMNYSHDDSQVLEKLIIYSGLASEKDKTEVRKVFANLKKADKNTHEIFSKFLSVIYKQIDINKPNVCNKDFPKIVMSMFSKSIIGKRVRTEISELLGFNKNDSRIILRKKEMIFFILLARYYAESYCRKG